MAPAHPGDADELADAMVAEGSPADLRAAVALPLPLRVIRALLGAPSEDQDTFTRRSETPLTLTRYTQAEVDEAQAEFRAYASDLVERKRARPGDDLLSEPTQISDSEDGRLSHDELIATVVGLLLAGHETTSNMILKMMTMLLSERERYGTLLADPGAGAGSGGGGPARAGDRVPGGALRLPDPAERRRTTSNRALPRGVPGSSRRPSSSPRCATTSFRTIWTLRRGACWTR
ncbi:hypothetical protein [Streptomyces antimycoticus]|uniref:hypothetical protein n=1 Tax=Streptomyces antimycoticus TaxID=68175 RepID=UPI003865E749|nr:cytochrome P450 [Streptomyces antimycoticus]